MGQTQTATIIQQEALHSVSLNPHWRVVRDAEEINSCLSIGPLLDQLTFDLSNSNWTSSITINPLSYDPVAVQMQNRELEIKEQSKIVYKMESIPNQRKLRTAQTQTEQDPYFKEKQYTQPKPQTDNRVTKIKREQVIPSPKMIRDYSEQPTHIQYHPEIRREKSNDQYKKMQQQNPYKLQNEVTENFSNDDDQSVSMSSITQNFEALKQHQGLQQYDDRSFIQNQRFWSSDHSSFLIEIPSQVMQKASAQSSFKPPQPLQPQIPDQFTQAQRRLTQQQSFGQKQNQFQFFQQQQLGQQSPTQKQSLFQQQDVIKKTQPLNQQTQITQSVPLEQQQQKQQTQTYYSDKKQQNQPTSKSPSINSKFQNERNLPNSPKTSSNQQHQFHGQGQKESMRQQFDRLLRESQQKRMAIMKPNGKPVTSLKSSDSDQDLVLQKNNTQKPASKKQGKLEIKGSPHKSGKSTYQQPTSYAERNKLKQKLNQSPPTSLQNLKQARNEIQKQKQVNYQSNQQLQKLNEKIEWISRMNQEQEQGEEVFRQIKNNVSNLKTAITQNISPSERGDKNSNTNRFSNREEEINLDNLPDFQEGSINLDRLSSYRESLEKQRERLSQEN